MDETLEQIQRISTERFHLYLRAGKQQLNPNQQERLNQINNQLPLLWDQHRREIAAKMFPRSSYAAAHVA